MRAEELPPRQKSTVVTLDVFRLCAALLVVGYHIFYFSWVEPRGDGGISDAVAANIRFLQALPYASGGWVGVDLFFVISGFVITMSAHGKRPAVFALARFTRLFPALLFFSLLTFLIVVGDGLLTPSEAIIRWLHSIVLLPVGPWIDGVIWTLTIEAIFYFLIFLSLFDGRENRFRLYTRVAAGVIAMFWLTVFLNDYVVGLGHLGVILDKVASAYFGRVILLSTGPFFLLGIFAYDVFQRGLSRQVFAGILTSIMCCMFIIYKTALHMPAVTIFQQSAFTPVAIWLGFSLVCAFALYIECRRTLSKTIHFWCRRIGLLTYPLYLIHDIPGGFVMGRLVNLGVNQWLAASMTIFLAIVLSYVFVTMIETRIRKMIGMNMLKTWVGNRQESLPVS